MKRQCRRIAALVAVLIGSGTLLLAPAFGATAVPWGTDANAHGYIGFCNLQHQNVTSGSIYTKPFAAWAIGTVPPPAAYTGKGENALLAAYQPIPDEAPYDWSGDSFNAATFYLDKQFPATEETYKDFSLHNFMTEYPPKEDGLYQFRMLFGKKGYGDYTSTYPATTIQVVGSTWHVVQGGTVDCYDARGISSEVLAGVSPTPPPTGKAAIVSQSSPSPSASSSGSTKGGANTTASPAPSSTVVPHAISGQIDSLSSSTSKTPLLIVLAVALAVALVVIAVLILRNRNPRSAR